MSLESLPHDDAMMVNISFSDEDENTNIPASNASSEYVPSQNDTESYDTSQQTTHLYSYSHSELKINNQNSNDALYSDALLNKKFIITGNVIAREQWTKLIRENGGVIYDPLQPPQMNDLSAMAPVTRRHKIARKNRKVVTSFSANVFGATSKSDAVVIHQDSQGPREISAASQLQIRDNLYVLNQDGSSELATMKYLFAKALRATPIEGYWIQKCIEKGTWSEPPTLKAQSKAFIFESNTKVMIRDAPLAFKTQWESLLREMGATVLSDRDMDQVTELFAILVETAPSYDTRLISKEYSIPVVNVKYMKRCLLRGEQVKLTPDLAYNAPHQQCSATSSSPAPSTPAPTKTHLTSFLHNEVQSITAELSGGQWTPQRTTKFIGDARTKDARGNEYYTQIFHKSKSYSINQCIKIHTFELTLAQQKLLAPSDNIALIRNIFRTSDGDSLLTLQMFTKRCSVDETASENEYELFLTTTVFDGVPVRVIHEKVNVLPRHVKLSKAMFYCTHEIDMASDKIVPLKNCLWRDPRNVVVLDPEPQEDDSGRATFFTVISFDGVVLCEHAYVQVETDTGDRVMGRITEIFQAKGLPEYNISVLRGKPDHESYQLHMNTEEEVSISTDEIAQIKTLQIVNNAQFYIDRDFSGNYWTIT